MDSSLEERFARLGPIRAIDRVSSGSPAILALTVSEEGRSALKPVDAMLALAKRGMTMLRAKRAIESLIDQGRVSVQLGTVESTAILIAELSQAGIAANAIAARDPVDVRALREKLGLTREQFALRYGLEQETLRNWETGKRDLDATARSYLRAIANSPDGVAEAYAPRQKRIL